MHRSDIYKSNYTKASDLPAPRTVTIKSAEIQAFKNDGKEQEKLVLSFKEKVKPLVCNLTNFDTIAAECGYGDETDQWLGKKIVLRADRTRFGTKMVDCVRVARPDQGELGVQPKPHPKPAAEPAPELEDEIPF